ncbi:MAG: alpha-glucan family phosphorylase [Candidatus Cloacimonetes bacterium]|nr:alpha-glucan family phosphorylase [Candidatus Cloacimonadota bacterium]
MKDHINYRNFFVKPKLPKELQPLMKLSQNIWSTWDMGAYLLFSRIEPVLFRKYNHNPVKLLQKISEKRLLELSKENGFLNEMHSVYEKFLSYKQFQGHYDKDGEKVPFPHDSIIAYFSMEYGLHESLPIYSGGLGVLSGDHIKSASDFNLPLIGFGLLYRYGYFMQKINIDGMQEEIYEQNEWFSKPVEKVKDKSDNELIISIQINNEDIYLKAWQVEVGNVLIYLLDSNINLNNEYNRQITDHLYDSNREMRILQEIVLAYGSIELMKKLNIKPKVYHLNEGHSAFLIVKRLEKLINEDKFSFEQAKELIRCSTVFTTHTPVPAGNEKFEMNLVKKYISSEIHKIGQNVDEFLNYGKVTGSQDFWLPALAIRFSKFINGVSKLHSTVSREMWHSIYPDIIEDEMPIKAITNGVHITTWLSRTITRLFDRYLGKDYLHTAENKTIWENVLSIPDLEIWEAHQQRKEQLISFIRNRLQESISFQGSRYGDQVRIPHVLNQNYLTIGFARRFATYKRADLIIKDEERLLQILRNERRPVQFIFAGKAHPADNKGKAMIKKLIKFARENKVEDRFIFLENYDINVARHLVQGVDVWLNNPIKPLEASGTSGMKAGMNGVVNLSVLDGWWPECYKPENGWVIKAGENIADEELRDKLEANEIYDLIENEIAPLYYRTDKNGVPREWVQKMKYSIYDVGLGFNTHRMLRDYIDEFYIPSMNTMQEISKNSFEKLDYVLNMEQEIKKFWNEVEIVDCKTKLQIGEIINSGKSVDFEVKLKIANAPVDLFIIELFYRLNDNDHKVIPMILKDKADDFATFKVDFKVIGAGEQSYNIRLRPKYCDFKKFPQYVKWYY